MLRAIFNIASLLLLLASFSLHAQEHLTADPWSPMTTTLKVDAGSHARTDAPVSVKLAEKGIASYQNMALSEVAADGTRRPVAFQPDPADAGRIWWILDGETAAEATRTYELTRPASPVASTPLSCTQDGSKLDIVWRGGSGTQQLVFSYNYGFVQPREGAKPAYIRSGYIHPLMSPQSRLMTEDQPADHLHHKGIWMPWTRTEFEGHPVDFWNLGDETGTVRFAGFNWVVAGPVFAGFGARHEHVDRTQDKERGGRIALNEDWDVRVYNVGGPQKGYWMFDFASRQRCASQSALKLLEYRYGGLGFRGAVEWKNENYKALSSEGKTHLNGHLSKAKWCDHSGRGNGRPDGTGSDEWSGVTILDNPANFRHPQPMRLWDKGGCFFNYAPVQTAEFEIKPGDEYASRYRFLIHEGDVNPDLINRVWDDYAEPATVDVID